MSNHPPPDPWKGSAKQVTPSINQLWILGGFLLPAGVTFICFLFSSGLAWLVPNLQPLVDRGTIAIAASWTFLFDIAIPVIVGIRRAHSQGRVFLSVLLMCAGSAALATIVFLTKLL